jgi:hypothetical protein
VRGSESDGGQRLRGRACGVADPTNHSAPQIALFDTPDAVADSAVLAGVIQSQSMDIAAFGALSSALTSLKTIIDIAKSVNNQQLNSAVLDVRGSFCNS